MPTLPMTFVSLFAGVGGMDLGLEAAGLRCVAQVEWDAECQRVLRRHWPDVPKWGDITDVHGALLPSADLVAFGSPCQDLSVAGKRAGFGGERSVLFYEATRVIREMREAHGSPTWVAWENVVGSFSSADGRDFGAVLNELADLGAVDICWRVLDARWFGVPQRRRRVFVVADLGGERAAQVLLEPESLCGDPEPSATAGEGAADGTGSGADGGRVYQCHGPNVGPIGALRSGNGHLTGGVPFTVFSESDPSRWDTHTHTPVSPLAQRDYKSGRHLVVNADD